MWTKYGIMIWNQQRDELPPINHRIDGSVGLRTDLSQNNLFSQYTGLSPHDVISKFFLFQILMCHSVWLLHTIIHFSNNFLKYKWLCTFIRWI